MSKFRKNRIRMTQALFLDMTADNSRALYTLEDEDVRRGKKLYPSIWKLYALYDNPTEYEFATSYFENYTHWCEIRELAWMKKNYQEARADLEKRIESKSFDAIKKLDTFPAQKWLAEGGYKDKEKAGRPSNAKLEGELKKRAEEKEAVVSDLNRIRGLKNG